MDMIAPSSTLQCAPFPGTVQYPVDKINKQEYKPGVCSIPTAPTCNTNSENSLDTINSLESDRWSQHGITSVVSVEFDDTGNSNENERNTKRCLCLHKLWGNCLLPAIFGIDKYRIPNKLCHKHPVSKQLISNVVNYNFLIRGFLRNGLLPEIKTLATLMYFPTGQIEADGLSVISAEIWAATYLLMRIHKTMREADFNDIRNAYSSLAWDSGQLYRTVENFHQLLFEFRSKIVPQWQEIDTLVGIPDSNSYPTIEITAPSLNSLLLPRNSANSNYKGKFKYPKNHSPQPLNTLQICDEFTLQTMLRLQIIPEIKSVSVSDNTAGNDFAELDYGQQVEIIKDLLEKPAKVIYYSQSVFTEMEPKIQHLISQMKSNFKVINRHKQTGFINSDENISCARAIKILKETLKLVFQEVTLTPSLSFDVYENTRATSDDIHSFLAYTDWVLNKLSEFHSMLKLCYNFALMCFDLDLPSFEKIIIQEKVSDDIFRFASVSSTGSLEDEKMNFKVASLTRLMVEASTPMASIQGLNGIDEDFEWTDFFRTYYHIILQRLPLRLKNNLLQFSPTIEAKSTVRKQLGIVTTKSFTTTEELLSETAQKLWNIRCNEQCQVRERGSWCSLKFSVSSN